MGTPTLVIRPGNPDFLDLPRDSPLPDWQTGRLVEMPTGIHRHPVVFVAYDEGVFAVKELPARLAESEYNALRLVADPPDREPRRASAEAVDRFPQRAGAAVEDA